MRPFSLLKQFSNHRQLKNWLEDLPTYEDFERAASTEEFQKCLMAFESHLLKLKTPAFKKVLESYRVYPQHTEDMEGGPFPHQQFYTIKQSQKISPLGMGQKNLVKVCHHTRSLLSQLCLNIQPPCKQELLEQFILDEQHRPTVLASFLRAQCLLSWLEAPNQAYHPLLKQYFDHYDKIRSIDALLFEKINENYFHAPTTEFLDELSLVLPSDLIAVRIIQTAPFDNWLSWAQQILPNWSFRFKKSFEQSSFLPFFFNWYHKSSWARMSDKEKRLTQEIVLSQDANDLLEKLQKYGLHLNPLDAEDLFQKSLKSITKFTDEGLNLWANVVSQPPFGIQEKQNPLIFLTQEGQTSDTNKIESVILAWQTLKDHLSPEMWAQFFTDDCELLIQNNLKGLSLQSTGVANKLFLKLEKLLPWIHQQALEGQMPLSEKKIPVSRPRL